MIFFEDTSYEITWASDFFLWGPLWKNMYKSHPHTIAELRSSISEKIQAISLEERAQVVINFARHFQKYL